MSLNRLTAWAIMFVLIVNGIGQSFIFTSLPPIGREIGLKEVEIGLIITVGAVVFVVFSFLWGRWINYLGLRRTIQVGTLIYAITTALLGFVLGLGLEGRLSPHETLYVSMALRATFTAGAAGVFPAAQAFFVASSTAEARTSAVANLSVAFSLGLIIGPAMAAFLSAFSLILPFYIIPILCAVALVGLQIYMLPMKLVKTEDQKAKINWVRHPVLPLFILSMSVLFCLSGVQQISVFFVQDILQLSAQDAAKKGGIAMTVMSVMMILVQLVAVQRLAWRPVRMIYLGSLLLLTAMGVLILSPNWIGVLIGLGSFGGGIGFLFPAIIAKQTLMAAPHEQAPIAGANASMQGIGIALGPIACAGLYQMNAQFPFILIGIVSAFIMLFYTVIRKRKLAN